MRTKPMPREWTNGWHGRRGKEQPLGARVNVCVALAFTVSFPTLFCKGGSYSETCAQRTAEDRGFLML
jgi:hypothetical protein